MTKDVVCWIARYNVARRNELYTEYKIGEVKGKRPTGYLAAMEELDRLLRSVVIEYNMEKDAPTVTTVTG